MTPPGRPGTEPAEPVPRVGDHPVRRLVDSDAAAWAEFAVLPQMQEHTSSSVTGEGDLRAMIGRASAASPDAPVLFGLWVPGPNGELIATFGFHTVSSLNRTAELTYAVRPAHWGRGRATAIAEAAVAWAFDVRRWVRVQATVLEPNLASRRVLEKCGFACEGRLRNFRIVRGTPRDYLLFARVPNAPPAPS